MDKSVVEGGQEWFVGMMGLLLDSFFKSRRVVELRAIYIHLQTIPFALRITVSRQPVPGFYDTCSKPVVIQPDSPETGDLEAIDEEKLPQQRQWPSGRLVHIL